MPTFKELLRPGQEHLVDEACPAAINPAFPISGFSSCYAIKNGIKLDFSEDACIACWNQQAQEDDIRELPDNKPQDRVSSSSQGASTISTSEEPKDDVGKKKEPDVEIIKDSTRTE